MRKTSGLRRIMLLVLILCLAYTAFVSAGGKLTERNAHDGALQESGGTLLDLLPNILKGLDLVARDPEGESEEDGSNGDADGNADATLPDTIEVWNGKEAVSMELEDYIIHVVAAEMPAEYAEEALKAQAVAARTYAVRHMLGEEHCKSGHTICTDHTCCQAFLTTDELRSRWGSLFDRYYSKICAAVNETSGEVIVCDGGLITAVYHSSSGGMTENCEAVFAVALPYLVSVESEGEESSPEFRNVTTYSASEFVKRVNDAFPQANMTTPIGGVDVWDRTDSGRVKLVRLGETVVTGQQMRNAFKLHSTNFSFEISGDTVSITCLGYGHGVGMSQCGANAMANEGADYIEILTHYYTGVDITKLETGNEDDLLSKLWKL